MKWNRNKAPGSTRAHGFTLVELVIALAVAAVILATAVPSFASFLQRHRISSATDQLYVSLNLARGEAIKRRAQVRVCPSSDAATCDTSGIDWSGGWLVEEVASGTDIRSVDSSSIHPSIAIDADDTTVSGVVFNATGDAFGTSGEFRICHSGSSVASNAVTISAVGGVETYARTSSTCDAG